VTVSVCAIISYASWFAFKAGAIVAASDEDHSLGILPGKENRQVESEPAYMRCR
jgi:hypothetical protein